MAYPTKNDLIRAGEVGRIQLENMVRVLDLFNTLVETDTECGCIKSVRVCNYHASFNSKPGKKEDDSAS